jgi:hypothetical protein
MKKYFLLIVLLLLIYSHTQAQTTDSTKTKSYRHHIGLNTQFAQDQFFNPNVRTPLQIMYKKQTKGSSAWRVGLGVFYWVTDDSNATPKQVSIYYAYSGLHYDWKGHFSLGYEWQQPLTKKWTVYYGADAQMSWDYRKFEGEITSFLTIGGGSPDILTGFDERYTLTIALKPFIGARLQLSKKCYLAIESSIRLYSQDNKNVTRFYTKGGTQGGGDIPYKNYGVSFQPYSGLYIFYLL